MWSILIPLAVLLIVIAIQLYRVKEAFADASSTDPTFNTPKAITIDKDQYLYVADTGNNTIRKITPTGDVLTLAGNPEGSGFNNGTGSGALFNTPTAVIVNDEGILYVADSENNCIRKVSPKGEVTTIAGLGGSSGAGYQDGTVTTQLRFKKPTGLCMDRQTKTTLFVVDAGNKKIRKLYLQSNGSYGSTTIADDFTFSNPYAIVQDSTDGALYVSDTDKIYILKSDAAGSKYTVTTLSDTAGDMKFINPTGLYFDPIISSTSKTLYVCQTSDNTIVKVTITKTAADATTYTTSKSIFAGQAAKTGTAVLDKNTNKIDGDGSIGESKLNAPFGIVKSNRVSDKGVADLNTFFIADSGSHTIRKVYPTDYSRVDTTLTLLTMYGTGTSGSKDKQTTSSIAGTTTSTTGTSSSGTGSSETSSNSASTSSSQDANKITLTLADLMALYGFSSTGSTTSSTSTTTPSTTDTTTVTGGATPTSAQTAKDFYNEIKPSLLDDIRTTISKQLSGSPYASLGPMGSGYDGSSAACAQGSELNSSVKNVIDSNDYIRKDSIPCYGCSL